MFIHPLTFEKNPPAEMNRRLSDRIELAFEQACDQGQLEVAACMLKGLDLALLGQPLPWDRRQMALGLLRACQSRLQALREARTAQVPAELQPDQEDDVLGMSRIRQPDALTTSG
jgi:hypothetical protein